MDNVLEIAHMDHTEMNKIYAHHVIQNVEHVMEEKEINVFLVIKEKSLIMMNVSQIVETVII